MNASALEEGKSVVHFKPAWQWNELQQVGTDYTDLAEVERYESRMSQWRDLPAEHAQLLAELALPERSHILEIGTGTGHFARAAARAGHRVTAVDVSPVMLRYAERKAQAEGLADIEFHHAGFLTLAFKAETFDAAVSVAALHHLPDVWKAVGLANVHCALKAGGRFLLGDVVFAMAGGDPTRCLDGFVAGYPEAMRKEVERHAAQEYSTLDWIMLGLLERAGFRILRSDADGKTCFVRYHCAKGD